MGMQKKKELWWGREKRAIKGSLSTESNLTRHYYCQCLSARNGEHHEYALYLDLEDIGHSRTKAKPPQTNGICERFNKTCKDEFYSVAFRRKVCRSVEEIQLDLDAWLVHYNNGRTHSGKHCYGKTPMRTRADSIPLAKERLFGHDESDGQGV